MMQAADAYMKGIALEDYAKDHGELQAAIKLWGVKKIVPP
jgi:ribulose 1,5-bisphosphate carboxylase large subunit-like protein